MSSHFNLFTLSAVLIAIPALATTARAADGEGNLKASLEVRKADAEGKPIKQQLVFGGKVEGFPVGTRIDIRFRLRGNRQHIAWYRALVDNKELIKGKSSVIKKPFSPGIYEVQFWLKVGTQTRDLRKWFTLNKGWSRRHQELLENVVITIGSPEEQQAFVNDGIKKLRDFLAVYKKPFAEVQTRVKAGTPVDAAWKTAHPKLEKMLLDVQTQKYNWIRSYVAIPLEVYRQKLNILETAVFRLVGAYNAGVKGLEGKVQQTEEIVKYLEEALSPAKALDLGGDDKKDK